MLLTSHCISYIAMYYEVFKIVFTGGFALPASRSVVAQAKPFWIDPHST